MYTRTLVASVAVAITLLLSSCGGGGGGSDAPVPVPTVQTPPASSDIAVSGFVAKGTITGGVVRATQYVNGVATAGTTTERWQFWVNNTYEPKIPNKYYLKPGDIVLWKFVQDQAK